MAYALQAFFDNLVHYTQGIESGNNNLRLYVSERWKGLRAEDIRELTKRRPNWSEDLRDAFDCIQDALEPLHEVSCMIEDVMVDRDRAAKEAAEFAKATRGN